MTYFRSGLAALTILAATSATAGPASEFEATFRQMYATYRVALFKTSAGQQAESASAVTGLAGKLAALTDTYGKAPPPQFAEDPAWDSTLTSAAELVTKANAQVTDNALAEAHETLEGVRDLFGDLHARNGVETFSDRMNAYHAAMEHLLDMDLSQPDAAQIGLVREQAAVLSYLADDVLTAPPPEAAGSAEYDTLATAFDASVKGLMAAARSGDASAVKAAVATLKAPYSKLFLKFG